MMKIFTQLNDSPAVKRIARVVLPYRLPINLGIHVVVFAVSYFFSLLLFNKLMLDLYVLDVFIKTFWPLLILRLGVFFYYDLFSGMWRFVSFGDLVTIIRAVIISSLLFYGLGLVWGRVLVEGQIYLLDMACCIMFCGTIRLLVRNFRETYLIGDTEKRRKKILIVGPVSEAQLILRDIVGNPKTLYQPLAVVDPFASNCMGGVRVCDVPVLSVQHLLLQRIKMGAIESVIVCWPGGTRRQIAGVIEQLQSLKAKFKIIPYFGDIIDGKVSVSNIRPIEIEDLLEREPVRIDQIEIGNYIRGKAVMVTGGAGSIGSEICRQVAVSGVGLLLILDRSENSLYDFEREMAGRFPDVPVVAVIGSINDAEGLIKLMREHGIDVVFHAAAYKHVPLMEKAPIESAYNNIIGTYNAACAAIEAGVQRFVMISSDKAVNPTNVMGVTKRIAEMVVQGLNNKNGTRFMTVRFGNVLGSAGSVIPIFKAQIERGEPLTVTHPDIERFFMTIPEAVQLVLQACTQANGGEIFVLDMGKPVKILQLAEKLITLSGMRPYEDIEIKFTGLRPGEKMYEELFNLAEKLLPTPHERIKSAQSQPVDHLFMEKQVAEIKTLITRKNARALNEKLLVLVPSYQCQGLAEGGCREGKF